MTKGWYAGWMLAALGLAATGAGVLAGGRGEDPKPAARPANTPKVEKEPVPPAPPIADRFARIKAEYQAQQEALWEAQEKAQTRLEQNQIYGRMAPDDVAYSRRMLDLATTAPADPAARDALLWVINKPGRSDQGTYGDEFARAAALLVRHHGDDPEAVRIGLQLDNLVSPHRDLLLSGLYASAKGRESKGLARMALAQYLESKAQYAAHIGKTPGRRKNIYRGVVGDDGKPYDKEVEQSDEEYAYEYSLRLCDSGAIRAEAERLYGEVIADYGDVPRIGVRLRELEALMREPSPKLNGEPMTADERRQVEAILARKQTLAQAAEARLDEMHNLVVGKPAPEIDGVDFDGKPLKLSDHRGKVVVLVFWGSWCGPCMREVPHERELAERLKGRPFALLGVDCNEEKSAGLKAMEAEKITWPNWHDGSEGDGPIVRRYHVRGYPTVFVIDAKGAIRGKQLLGASLDKLVDDLLREAEAKDAPK